MVIVPEHAELTGAEAIALLLAEAGVQQVFGHPGTSELSICDAVDVVPGVRLVNGRGDAESAFMAAGASWLTPMKGVALLHGARGLTNAAGSLADVRRNEIGTLFLVGLPSSEVVRFLPPNGEDGLIELVGGFARWAWQARPVPERDGARTRAAYVFVSRLREAMATAKTPPWGPALFAVPSDVADARWIPLRALASEIEAQPAELVDLGAALPIVRAARRVVLLVDDYALRFTGIHGALDDFACVTGAAVFQVWHRSGPLLFQRVRADAVRNFVGWLDPDEPAHRKIFGEADLLITVEDRDIYPRVVGELPGCRKIALSSDPDKVLKNGYLRDGDCLLPGDPARTMARLTAELSGVPARPRWTGADAAAAGAGPEAATDAARRARGLVAHELADLLAHWDSPVLVDDSRRLGGLIAEHYDQLPAEVRVFGGHGGWLGAGLPYAIGLAVAEPDARVLCLLSGPALTSALPSLAWLAGSRAGLVIVVCDHGEQAERAESSDGGRRREYLDDAVGLDYRTLAGALGLHTERVAIPLGGTLPEVTAAAAEFGTALRRAATAARAALVELVLPADPDAWRGIWHNTGLETAVG